MKKTKRQRDVPAIRFPGFTDSWEQRKVFEIADRFDNLRVPVAANLRIPGNTPYYGANGIQDYVEGYTHDGEYILVAEDGASDLKNYPVNYVNGRIWVNNHAHVLQGKEKIANNKLLSYAMRLADIESVLVGGGRAKLNADIMMNLDIAIPSFNEQEQIGAYFSNLDNLITLQERKCRVLRELKKCMLQKMFPKNGSDIPEIRFPGFTDSWEQRKLGDIVERVVRKNTNNESSLPLTISAQYGLVDQITYFNNRVASRDVSNYYLVLNGEFAYNKSTSDGFPFGAIKRLDLYEKGVLSTLYIVFSIKNQSEIDSDYLTVFFDTDRWHKGVSERAAEGARNHGLLNISADDFFDIDIFLPRHKEEQVAIGSYLRHLDHLIILQERKCKVLRELKKCMLQKMFV